MTSYQRLSFDSDRLTDKERDRITAGNCLHQTGYGLPWVEYCPTVLTAEQRERGSVLCAVHEAADIEDHGSAIRLVECIDRRQNSLCAGPVKLHESLSGTGTLIARCDRHWDQRLQLQERLDKRYPVRQPADFDPLYAGENWDED